MTRPSYDAAERVQEISEDAGYGHFFERWALTPRSTNYPDLVWANNDGLFVLRRFEIERHSPEWLSSESRIGRQKDGFDLTHIHRERGDGVTLQSNPFGLASHGLHFERVYEFFEQIRRVKNPIEYDTESLRRVFRFRDFIPLIEQELCTSETIFEEIIAWQAAIGRPAQPRFDDDPFVRDAAPLTAMRDVFVANGVPAADVDAMIAEPDPVEILRQQREDALSDSLKIGDFKFQPSVMPILEWANGEGIVLRFHHRFDRSLLGQTWTARASMIGIDDLFVPLHHAIHHVLDPTTPAPDYPLALNDNSLTDPNTHQLLTDRYFLTNVLDALTSVGRATPPLTDE